MKNKVLFLTFALCTTPFSHTTEPTTEQTEQKAPRYLYALVSLKDWSAWKEWAKHTIGDVPLGHPDGNQMVSRTINLYTAQQVTKLFSLDCPSVMVIVKIQVEHLTTLSGDGGLIINGPSVRKQSDGTWKEEPNSTSYHLHNGYIKRQHLTDCMIAATFFPAHIEYNPSSCIE